MNVRRILLSMVAAFVIAAALAFLLLPATSAEEAGEKTYKAKCVSCHAADGTGSPIGKKLGAHDFHSPEVQKMTDAELTEVIVKGKNKMPGYEKGLKADEIKSLVAYVRALSTKK